MAIRSYGDNGTWDIAKSVNSREARAILPVHLHQAAKRRLAFLAAVESLEDLRARKGLGLHALKRDRAGYYAIKINDQYRICFRWLGKDADDVEITDYH